MLGVEAERQASGAPESRSEERAEAVGRRLHALVGHGIGPSPDGFPGNGHTV